jgi:hypothetical protein
LALTTKEALQFKIALLSANVTIKDWCEANGVNLNLFYQELGGFRDKWVERHEALAKETIAEYMESEERDKVS